MSDSTIVRFTVLDEEGEPLASSTFTIGVPMQKIDGARYHMEMWSDKSHPPGTISVVEEDE